MISFKPNFTKKEKRIRRLWLLLSVLQYPLIPFLLVCSSEYMAQHLPAPQGAFSYTVIGLLSLLSFWPIYHFAYKKKGVGLLTCWVINSLISLPYWLYSESKVLSERRTNLSIAIFGLEVILFVIWIIYCMKLRKINLRIQMQQQWHNDYSKISNLIQEARSLDELEQNMESFRLYWPESIRSEVLQKYEAAKLRIQDQGK